MGREEEDDENGTDIGKKWNTMQCKSPPNFSKQYTVTV